MRVAHLTLAQCINIVRAKTKIMRKIRVFFFVNVGVYLRTMILP